MKKIIVFSFLLFSVGAFAQNDVLKDTVVKPVITEPGKPDGEKVILNIGEDGGSLKSSDGKVELVFPAGALTENTNIIIQPVTNLAPNGAGKAYWFEPSGIQFKKPVQIIFNYTDEEAEICPPDLMGLAIQNKQGQWSFVDYDSWDSTTRSLKGSIIHFSGATNVNKMRLAPSGGLIKVRTKLQMEIKDISKLFEYEGEEFFYISNLGKNKTTMWYVNDNQGGTYHDGKIVPTLERVAEYTAPSTLPLGKNPVTIKVELYLIKKSRGGKTLNLIKTFKSNIQIYDEYEVTMISRFDGSAGTAIGTVTYTDTGSFVVYLDGKEAKLIEKVNKNTSSSLKYSGGKCAVTLLKTGTGNIHIEGYPVVKVTPPSSPSKPAMIEITFSRFPTIFPLLQFTCQKLTTTNDQVNAMVAGTLPAFPQQIKFEADVGEQTIMEFGKPGDELYAKFTVKQLKDD